MGKPTSEERRLREWAGIGKSRLLLEFRRALAQAGEETTWLEGRSISFGQAMPFLPVVDQLRESFGIEEWDGEPEIIAKVEHAMRRLGELEAHIPYIRYLLSVDPGEPAVLAMEAQPRRKRVFDALQALSLRGARLKPLVLVFEDLHWIDTSSEEYIGSLIDAVAGVPLMLLLTYRIGYTPPFGVRSFHTALILHSLSEAETLTMAGRVLGTEQFPEDLKAVLMGKAEGVLLFVEEVTKTLLDLEVLWRENGDYRMVKKMAEVSVPDTIQGIIMARLDRLGEEGKRTVQLASVIDRQFLVRLLERISDVTVQLEGLLRDLQTLEVIYRQGLLPEPAYIFKHAVIQDGPTTASSSSGAGASPGRRARYRRALCRSTGRALREAGPSFRPGGGMAESDGVQPPGRRSGRQRLCQPRGKRTLHPRSGGGRKARPSTRAWGFIKPSYQARGGSVFTVRAQRGSERLSMGDGNGPRIRGPAERGQGSPCAQQRVQLVSPYGTSNQVY